MGEGHRAAKQVRRRQVIVESLVVLVRGAPIESVTVKDVARLAEISEATFFNYFASKDAALAEWIVGCVDAALERAAAHADDRVLRRAIRGACEEIAETLARDLDVARVAMRRVALGEPQHRGAPPRGWRASTGAERLVERAQQREEVRADWPAARLGALLRAGLLHGLSDALGAGAALTRSDLADGLGRTSDLLLDGFRKRHERVRATSARMAPGSPGA